MKTKITKNVPEKPKTLKEYKEWLKKEHGVEINEKTKTYYESITTKVKSDLEKSDFWISIKDNYQRIDQEYILATSGYGLFLPDKPPEFEIKSFDSFLLKTFRKNVIQNKSWPSEPASGWILPENWLSKITDIVRTCFVVKYLDGVKYFADALCTICKENKLYPTVDFEAKEEGYYAAHALVTQIFDIPGEEWDTLKQEMSIEIQITTQLQEGIRKLLHKYYDEQRKKIALSPIKWQWDYKSDEFSTNYLGHILHYVEGMIMEIREKQQERQ